MNSLKTLLVVAVLGAVACAVYVSITRNPGCTPPQQMAEGWSQCPQPPMVQMPVPGGAGPQAQNAPYGAPAPSAPYPPQRPADGGGPAAMGVRPSPGGAAAAPPYVPQESAALPVGNPGDAAPAPYPSAAYPAAPAEVSSPAAPVAANSGPPTGGPTEADIDAGTAAQMQAVRAELDRGNLAEAHLLLSRLYDSPNLSGDQSRQVTELLDQLAGTVVYSRRHQIAPAYTVRSGETLEEIAQAHNVPWQLLANINGVRDPRNLTPGQPLKVVRGPFSALIHLDRFELTLMLGERYAGRFRIGIGRDHSVPEGDYIVTNKSVDPTHYVGDRVVHQAGDPNNPLGQFRLGLAQRPGQQSTLAIHGTNDPSNVGRTGGPGAISLGDRDIRDVFGILSVGSKVVIRR